MALPSIMENIQNLENRLLSLEQRWLNIAFSRRSSDSSFSNIGYDFFVTCDKDDGCNNVHDHLDS